MVVTFTTDDYDIEYETVKITKDYAERQRTEKHGIYSYSGYTPLSEPKSGKEMKVCNVREDLKNLLQHLNNFITIKPFITQQIGTMVSVRQTQDMFL